MLVGRVIDAVHRIEALRDGRLLAEAGRAPVEFFEVGRDEQALRVVPGPGPIRSLAWMAGWAAVADTLRYARQV